MFKTIRKRDWAIIASILLVALSMFAWAETQPITEIKNYDDLKTFAAAVNGGETYEGKTVNINNDIVMSDDWKPIGAVISITEVNGGTYSKVDIKTDKPFMGTLNGNGYKITGLKMNYTTDNFTYSNTSTWVGGLFIATENAIIKDLVLEDVSMTDSEKKLFMAPAVAMATNTQFINVDIKSGTIDCARSSGIANYMDGGKIVSCDVAKDVTLKSFVKTGTKIITGGLVQQVGFDNQAKSADARIVISECTFSGKMEIDPQSADFLWAGGMYGGTSYSSAPIIYFNLIVDKCKMDGSITVESSSLDKFVYYDSASKTDKRGTDDASKETKEKSFGGILGRTHQGVPTTVVETSGDVWLSKGGAVGYATTFKQAEAGIISGDITTYYTSLDEAIANGGELVVVKDVTTKNNYSVAKGVSIDMDLQGYRLARECDAKDNGVRSAVFRVSGDLTFKGDKTELKTTGDHTGAWSFAVRADETGSITFNSKTTNLTSTNDKYTAAAFTNYASGDISFNGDNVMLKAVSEYGITVVDCYNCESVAKTIFNNSGNVTIHGIVSPTKGYGLSNTVGLRGGNIEVTSNVDALNIIMEGSSPRNSDTDGCAGIDVDDQGKSAIVKLNSTVVSVDVTAGMDTANTKFNESAVQAGQSSYVGAAGVRARAGKIEIGDTTKLLVSVKDGYKTAIAVGVLAEKEKEIPGIIVISGDSVIRAEGKLGSYALHAKDEGTISMCSEGKKTELFGDIMSENGSLVTLSGTTELTGNIIGSAELVSTGTLKMLKNSEISIKSADIDTLEIPEGVTATIKAGASVSIKNVTGRGILLLDGANVKIGTVSAESIVTAINTAVIDSKLTLNGTLKVGNGVKLTIAELDAAAGSIELSGSGVIVVTGAATGTPKLTVAGTNAINISVGASSDMSFKGAVINGVTHDGTISAPDGGGKYDPYKLAGISVSPQTMTLYVGEKSTLSAVLRPSGAAGTITWESSDTNIVTVDEKGSIEAKKEGTATITAKSGTFSAACAVTVKPVKVTSIKLSQTSLTLVNSASADITAEKLPKNATAAIVWKSDNEAIATVADGKITAAAVGKANITATADGITAKCVVTVVAGYKAATDIIVTPASLKLAVNASKQLTAEVYPADATNKTVTWSRVSGDASINVDAKSGLVTAGTGAATATIRAEADKISKDVVVTVVAPDPETLVLGSSKMALYVGEKAELTAAVGPAAVTDKRVTWSKTDTDSSIALDTEGPSTKVSITASKPGTSVIKATKNSLTAECSVTVLEVPKKIVTASALTLDKNSALVALGGTMQLTAAIEPANADGTFTWSAASTSADVSAVSGKATVKAVKAGTTAVTVTWKGVGGDELKATCNITAEDMSAPVKAVVKEETVKQLEEKNILVAVTAPATDKAVISTDNTEVVKKLEVASDGSLVMSKAAVDAIAKEIGQSVTPLPVIEAEVPISGDLEQTVIMTMLMPGGSIQAKTVGEMILVKLLNTAKNETLERVGTIEALTSGKWLIKKAFTEEVLDANAVIDPMQTYEVNVAVRDNSVYDLNNELGKVVDPIAASVKTQTSDPSKGSSSSGCNAGFAALALLAIVPVIYRKKK